MVYKGGVLMTKGDKLISTIGYVLIVIAIVNMVYPDSNIMGSNFKNGVSVFTFFYALSAGLTTISENKFRKSWNSWLSNILLILAIGLGLTVGWLTNIDVLKNNIITPIVDNFISNGTLMILNLGLLFVNIRLNEKKEEQKEKIYEKRLKDEVRLAKKEVLQEVLKSVKKDN